MVGLPGNVAFRISAGYGSQNGKNCGLVVDWSNPDATCLDGTCESDVATNVAWDLCLQLMGDEYEPCGDTAAGGTIWLDTVPCTKIDCGEYYCPECASGGYEVTGSFDVYVEFEADTYMEIKDVSSGIYPCLCHEKDANNNWFRWMCSDLWCYYPMDKDPSWIPPKYGRIWIETDDNPTITYKVTVNGESHEGSFTRPYKIINPSSMGAKLITSVYWPELTSEPCGSVSFYRTGGLATPNWESCTYTQNGNTIASIGGSTYTYYAFDGIFNNGWMVDYCGSFNHSYSNGAHYIDGPAATGATLKTGDSVPTWHEDTKSWGCDSDGTTWGDSGVGLNFGGWWKLDGSFDGPYWRCQWNPSIEQNECFAEMRSINVGYDEAKGYYRTIGPVWVTNPGTIDQPDFPCSNPDHPYEEGGCAHTDYHDQRVLTRVSETGTSWNALKFSVPKERLAYTISRSITAAEGNDSISITGLENISLWGTRYISLDFTTSDTTKAPFTLVLDGKEYTVTDTTKWIDLLCPTNYSGSGNSDSLIPTTQPATESHGTSVSWDLGIYRINTLEIRGLKHGESYTFNSITKRKKEHADGGSFVVLINPQASWMGTSPSPTRNPESDSFVAEYAGEAMQAHHHPHVYYQPSGLVFVDGMLAGEIIQTQFLKTHDEPCGDMYTTGDVWSVLPMGTDTGAFSAYPGNPDGWITVEKLGSPAGCDELIAYLEPGLYGDYLKPETEPTCTEINVSACLRLDYIELPYMFGSYTFDVEKAFNGLLAVRVVDSNGGNGPFNVNVKQGTGGSRKNLNISTDKCGFGLTWAGTGTTQSLYNNYSADVTATIGGKQVTGSTQIRNRKCSIITLKGNGQLAPKYCHTTGKPVLTTGGKPALTCCN